MELKKQQIGTIKFFIQDKGYGFIASEDGSKEIFFHVSGIGDDKLKPEKDVQVIYNERNTIRGLIAVDIVPA